MFSMRKIGTGIERILVAQHLSAHQYTHFCCFFFFCLKRDEYPSDFSADLTHRKHIMCGIFRKKNHSNQTYIRDVMRKNNFLAMVTNQGHSNHFFFFFFVMTTRKTMTTITMNKRHNMTIHHKNNLILFCNKQYGQ